MTKRAAVKRSRNMRQRSHREVKRTIHDAVTQLAAYARYNNRADLMALKRLAHFVEEQFGERTIVRADFAVMLEECVADVYSHFTSNEGRPLHARNVLVSVDEAGLRQLQELIAKRAEAMPTYWLRVEEGAPVPALNSRGGDA